MSAFTRPTIRRTAAVLALAACAACSPPQTPAAGPAPAPPAAWTDAVVDARYVVLFTEAGAGAHPMGVTGEIAPGCTATLHFRHPGEAAVRRTVAYAAPTVVLAKSVAGEPCRAPRGRVG